jgi:hypothetical protein
VLRRAIFVCLGGCSIALSGPDPARHPRTAPTCDTSKTLVKLDGTMAVGLGLIGLALISGNQGGSGGGMAVTGALYAAAALRGNNVVDRCRAAFDQYDHELAPGPLADEDAPKLRLPTPRLVAPPVAPPPPAEVTAATTETDEAPATPAPPAPVTPAPAAPPPGEDAFHTTVGQQPPVRAARQVATPAPAMSPWREFWREVP